MPACAANAMQHAKDFVLERALVMVALTLDIAQDYLSVSGIPLLTPIIGVTETSLCMCVWQYIIHVLISS